MARKYPEKQRKPPRDWGRLLASLACLLFGMAGAVPFGVGLLVRTELVRSWAARETARALERELGLLGQYRVVVQAWPFAFGLSDVVVQSNDGLGPALEVARISVRPRLFALMGGQLDAGQIEIDAPRARLVMQNGKLTNVSYRLPATTGSGGGHPPFRSIAITDATVDADIDGLRVRGRDIDLDVSADEEQAYDVALRTGEQSIVRSRAAVSLDPADGEAPAVDEDVICQLDARVRWIKGSLIVRRLGVSGFADDDKRAGTLPGCSLPASDPRRVEIDLSHLKTALPSGRAPDFDGGVKVRVPLMLANRFMPLPALRGYITADTEVHYQSSLALPLVRGRIGGSGIELDRYHLVSDLAADLTIDGDSVRSDTISVGFSDGTIVIRNLVIEPLKKGAPIHMGSVDESNVRFPAMMRDLAVTPHAHVDWFLRSTHIGAVEGNLVPIRLDGEFTAHTSDFEVFDKAVDDPARAHMIGVKEARLAGHLGVRPDAVIFRNSTIDFGESHLEANVSLGFHNDLVLSIAPTSRLELANVSPLANLKMAGRSIMGAEMRGKFSDPVLTGELAVTGFSLAGFPLGDLTSGKVRFRPLTVDFSDVHAKKGKSVFDIPTARLDFNGPATLVADANVNSPDLTVRDFLNMWHFDEDPRFDDIDGRGRTSASIHYQLGGRSDVCGSGLLGVRGMVHLASADLFGEHYDKLDSDFDYTWLDRDAADQGIDLDIRSMVMKKGRGTIFGSGTLRRGGIFRAEIAADDVPLAHIQGFGSGAKLLEGSVSGTGTLGGTLDELAADMDLRITPLRLGTAVMPGSKLHVRLVPSKKAVQVVGHTRCGGIISPPFDRNEFDRDGSAGTFHFQGELFDRQVSFDDVTMTRQRAKTTAGTVAFNHLDLSAIFGLAAAGAPGAAAPEKPRTSGFLSASLDIAALTPSAPEKMRATLQVAELELRSQAGALALRKASPPITIGDDHFVLPPLDWEFRAGNGLKGSVSVAGELSRLSSNPEMKLSATVAPFDLSAITSALPRVERASGTVDATLNITGKVAAPVYAGEAHLRKGEIALRGLAMPISDADFDVTVGGDEVRLIRGTARFGGGTVTVAGHAPIHGFKLGDVSATVSARSVAVPIVDGIDMTCDADLRAEWNERGAEEDESPLPKITGDVTLTSFSYTRPIGINADIGALAQRGRRKMFDSYDPAEDTVSFEIKLRSRDPLRLRNNLVEAQLVIDSDAVLLSGTNQRFGLRGRMRLLPGGRLRLRANEFEIRQGYVRFDDPTRIAPHVDVTAVTDYRRYAASNASTSAGSSGSTGTRAGGSFRITLHAYGDADDLRLDMTSEPALSQEDIVLLLTIGMTRAEIDQLQASSLGGTAALEALSSLTGADTAVRKALPVIDDFRFGSAYSSRTGRTEPTVTLGKRLTDQVRANVTSGLSENREIRSNLEWKLTPRVSVQGSYDNVNDVSSSSLGNLGADVRFRLEFE